MLRKIRDWYRVFFLYSLVFDFARLLATIVVGTVLLALLASHRQFDRAGPVLAEVLIALAILGFAAWLYWDVKRTLRSIARKKQTRKQQDADAGS